jgi:hypothetical protein
MLGFSPTQAGVCQPALNYGQFDGGREQ